MLIWGMSLVGVPRFLRGLELRQRSKGLVGVVGVTGQRNSDNFDRRQLPPLAAVQGVLIDCKGFLGSVQCVGGESGLLGVDTYRASASILLW